MPLSAVQAPKLGYKFAETAQTGGENLARRRFVREGFRVEEGGRIRGIVDRKLSEQTEPRFSCVQQVCPVHAAVTFVHDSDGWSWAVHRGGDVLPRWRRHEFDVVGWSAACVQLKNILNKFHRGDVQDWRAASVLYKMTNHVSSCAGMLCMCLDFRNGARTAAVMEPYPHSNVTSQTNISSSPGLM